MRIGVISDTHGLLRDEVREFLRNCDHIIHAGDVGDIDTLNELRAIGPMTAVYGNVDAGRWASSLPPDTHFTLGGRSFYLIHNIHYAEADLENGGFDVVVYGHSHMPEIRRAGPVTYLNPGSAGPRRFGRPVSYARIEIDGPEMTVELETIEGGDLKLRNPA